MKPEKFDDSTRDATRTRVLMSATLVTADGPQRVMIRDISRIGAQVSTKGGIRSECDAIFTRGSLFAAVRIAWATSDEAGIHFYRELSAEEIEGTLPGSLLNDPR